MFGALPDPSATYPMSSFGIVPPEVPVIRSLDGLAPKFRTRVEAMLIELEAKGFDPMIAESLRTAERQRYLYGFGREYDDGRGIVTYSSTGHASWHYYGLAVDVISRAKRWNAPSSFWCALGESATAHGLAWGGNWPTFPDKPHVQFGAPMRSSPSSRIYALYESGGIEAVWKEVGAI